MFGQSAEGFFHGFIHPFGGLDHLLAMFSVGLWGAQMGGRSLWSLPVTFPLIMVLGGMLGIFGVSLVGIEIGIALSIVVLGIAIFKEWKPSETLALALISVFAICHGYAHGVELPNATNPADYALGFVVATGLIHIFGIGLGVVSKKFLLAKVTQILSALITLGGVYFLIMAI